MIEFVADRCVVFGRVLNVLGFSEKRRSDNPVFIYLLLHVILEMSERKDQR